MMSLEHYREMIAFLWPSLAVAAAIAGAAGPAGTLVILRRDSLLTLALPQVVAVGIALGLRFDWPPLYPALAVLGLTLALLAWGRSQGKSDALLPALYIGGLAVSILLIVNAAAHLEELQNLLVGMDVAVLPSQAAFAIPILAFTALPSLLLWRRWLLLAQSPSAAQIAGLRPARWHLFFLITLATIVLVGTNIVGVVLVLTLLFLPPLAALPWSRRLPAMMALSTALGLLSLVLGFVLSNEMSWPLSHSVAGAGIVFMLLSHAVHVLSTWRPLSRNRSSLGESPNR
jgi:zinc/manganese transport system permease protein